MLDDGRGNEVRFLATAKVFFLLHDLQICSGATIPWVQWPFLWRLSGRGVKLTAHLYPAQRLTYGDVPPLTHMSSWHDA